MLLSWIFRDLLIAVGFVDAPQFAIVQMAVALILVVVIVAVLAFWPERWSHMPRIGRPMSAFGLKRTLPSC